MAPLVGRLTPMPQWSLVMIWSVLAGVLGLGRCGCGGLSVLALGVLGLWVVDASSAEGRRGPSLDHR
eukprot:CAMPEP_0119429396 /NCGR_PEP_ID=MMETSP1335-20130426/42142_1 /TAXON_ID=259385 /ORGANISM="Chrysoculter rhomboideus, Strain RCC1486" /LENGTH=66 /DNA_ID=CAMNT_0007455113 /DNA_START=45 /DNA_END=241 /DNA_ORIENTATION=+